jgi:hypothetical protein
MNRQPSPKRAKQEQEQVLTNLSISSYCRLLLIEDDLAQGESRFFVSQCVTCTLASISATIAMWKLMRQFPRTFFC